MHGLQSGWVSQPFNRTGRKTVQQICGEKGVEIEAALQRLAAQGIQASQDALIKTIAAEAGLQPIAVVNLITANGHSNQ